MIDEYSFRNLTADNIKHSLCYDYDDYTNPRHRSHTVQTTLNDEYVISCYKTYKEKKIGDVDPFPYYVFNFLCHGISVKQVMLSEDLLDTLLDQFKFECVQIVHSRIKIAKNALNEMLKMY